MYIHHRDPVNRPQHTKPTKKFRSAKIFLTWDNFFFQRYVVKTCKNKLKTPKKLVLVIVQQKNFFSKILTFFEILPCSDPPIFRPDMKFQVFKIFTYILLSK